MGILRRLHLVEDVYSSEPEPSESYETATYNETPTVEATVPEVIETADSLIADTYAINDLSDMSHSIFKVEELSKSLPNEMLTTTKQETVLSILGNFGITVLEVVTDGENRLEVINSVKKSLNDTTASDIAEMRKKIEEHKDFIARCESEISKAETTLKQSNEIFDDEISRVEKLIEFIGGNTK